MSGWSALIMAKLAAVLWAVILVISGIAWLIVEGICQGVRKFNEMEDKRDTEERRRLESWEWSDDG